MIHTVKINDIYPSGKRLLTELHRHPKAVEFENPASNDEIPEGYMTSEEFRKKAIEKVRNFCDSNGIL